MTTLIQDIRYGLRTLGKSPGFTIVAVITLALGIGANTAIFSIVNAVLLKPLPFPESDRLMFMTSAFEDKGISKGFAISYPDFLDWRATAKSFSGMASYHDDTFTITGLEQPLHVKGETVSGDFFSVLAIKPLLGRGLTREDEKPGTRSVVLSHELWQAAFHGDPNIVGKPVTIDMQSYTVAGVMPAGFTFPVVNDPPRLWQTFAREAEVTDPVSGPPPTAQRGSHFLRAVARLKPGVAISSAHEEMNVISHALANQYPDTNKKMPSVQLTSELEHLVGKTRSRLILLLVFVSVVLLIACLNVANLLLVRASKRSREIAVRSALGAKRSRVVRQMLTESCVLAASGAALAIPIAMVSLKAFINSNAQELPRIQAATIDGTVLSFAAGITLLTSLIFGLVPAIRASNPNLTQFMKEGRGTTAGASNQRLRGTLVVVETAFGLALLVVAGLLLRSFQRLISVDPGLNPHNVQTLTFDLPEKKYPEARQVDFHTQLLARLQNLPGVVSAGAVTPLPLSGNLSIITFEVEGRPVPKSEQPSADIKIVTPNYFRTLAIPIKSGRDFTERDIATAPGVMIVNEAFAHRYFPGENALGKRITIGASNNGKAKPREIVAVVGNVKGRGLDSEELPEYYIPYAQLNFGSMTVCIRTAGDPHAITSAVRSVVASMDNDLPIYDIKSMEEYMSLSVATPRLHAMLLQAFAGLALLLTAVGLYGVISYAVAQRTHEIGVRMTLGASRGNVVGMVLKSGLKLTFIGVVAGLAIAFAVTRLFSAVSSLLYGVTSTDAITFAAVIVLVSAVSLLACYIPAYRASKVDPMIALRYE